MAADTKTTTPKRPRHETLKNKRKILGTLTEEELLGLRIAMRAVDDIRTEVNTRSRQLGVIEAGYNALIMDMREKYKLPEEYSVDLKSGKLGAKGVF